MNVIIYRLVLNYLNTKVTNNLKDEFINASLHFNINNDIYKKYSPVQIEYMISKISSDEIIDYVELCSVYGYILYRAIEQNELNDEERIEGLQIVLEISNSITSYLRNLIGENELFDKLLNVTEKLNLTKDQNEKIIKMLNQ
ncbi:MULTISPECIES: hypothetical protein [Clostridium]|jgi:hypothetical protein|uniref:Uncharacterized protein n=2 Tax=root TaxID=1 RepID=R9BSA7_9CLOT|nr:MULTISPECIES: hypothetical protein [Clostridium]EOR20039.1 hypothetical protein A500_18927 [Clostridium sartagoforme AAU1]KLE14841.1 hypothetical protein AAT22_14200 [Clostridium sp. C8]